MTSPALDALLHENRRFDPPDDLAANANAKAGIYDEAAKDRLGFWEKQAEELTWAKRWDTVLDWNIPFAKWFVGGTLNASVNAVDRHVEAGKGDKVAFHWVSDGEQETRVEAFHNHVAVDDRKHQQACTCDAYDHEEGCIFNRKHIAK